VGKVRDEREDLREHAGDDGYAPLVLEVAGSSVAVVAAISVLMASTDVILLNILGGVWICLGLLLFPDRGSRPFIITLLAPCGLDLCSTVTPPKFRETSRSTCTYPLLRVASKCLSRSEIVWFRGERFEWLLETY
jgi:hypothetical protein